MAETPAKFPLAHLPLRLQQLYGHAPRYQTLYSRAVHGNLPVERVGGRLLVSEVDIPRIASLLGLDAAPAASAA